MKEKGMTELSKDIAFEIVKLMRKELKPDRDNIDLILNVFCLSVSYYIMVIARSMLLNADDTTSDHFQKNIDIVYDLFIKHLKETINIDIENKTEINH